MSGLGKLTQKGVTNPENPVFPGGWTVSFKTDQTPRVEFEVYHAAVKGPASSTFEVWIDDTFYDNVVRGDINSFDPTQPMLIRPGDSFFFHYSTNAGAAPKATAFFREPGPS